MDDHDDFEAFEDGGDSLCDCGKMNWAMCDCGEFFLNHVCGLDPSTGYCSMAGSEDCDWECPRGRS